MRSIQKKMMEEAPIIMTQTHSSAMIDLTRLSTGFNKMESEKDNPEASKNKMKPEPRKGSE